MAPAIAPPLGNAMFAGNRVGLVEHTHTATGQRLIEHLSKLLLTSRNKSEYAEVIMNVELTAILSWPAANSHMSGSS